MSTGSSASSPAGAERCSRAPSARSTRCSRSSPAARPIRRARSATPSARSCSGTSSRPAPPGSLGPSARFAGFADSLAGALTEIEASLLDPEDLGPGLADLTRAYRAELERLAVRDRGMVRRRAVERLTSELGSWNGAPVFAYGFEDLTGAEWRLIEALAARGEVHVSLPYEPGRAAFASLSRTVADLGALAGGDIVELAPRLGLPTCRRVSPISSAHLFDDTATPAPLDSSVRFLEGAGRRATLELVAETVLELVRDGIAPEEIAIVCPSLERSRASIETAFGALGVPVSIEARPRLAATAFGQALLSLLRFAWGTGTRRELFSFLRTPYAGLGRSDVDFLEGRLRGRAVVRGDRTIEETTKLRTGRPLPMLELLADEDAPLAAARAVVLAMARNAYGLGSPPVGAAAKRDLRAAEAAGAILDELERLQEAGIAIRDRGRARGPRPRHRPRRRGRRARAASRCSTSRVPARAASRRSS